MCLFFLRSNRKRKDAHNARWTRRYFTRHHIPRAVEKVVEASKINEVKGWSYTLKASYVEIYNETIRDLLSTVGHSADITHKIIHENGSTTISGSRRQL